MPHAIAYMHLLSSSVHLLSSYSLFVSLYAVIQAEKGSISGCCLHFARVSTYIWIR